MSAGDVIERARIVGWPFILGDMMQRARIVRWPAVVLVVIEVGIELAHELRGVLITFLDLHVLRRTRIPLCSTIVPISPPAIAVTTLTPLAAFATFATLATFATVRAVVRTVVGPRISRVVLGAHI